MHMCIHARGACSSMPRTSRAQSSLSSTPKAKASTEDECGFARRSMHGSAGCTRVYMHGAHVRACHTHHLGEQELGRHVVGRAGGGLHTCQTHAIRMRDAHAYACMGCMFGVPAVTSRVWTRPKSHSFAWPAMSSSTLCDFRSRCTIGGRRECKYAMPSATCMPMPIERHEDAHVCTCMGYMFEHAIHTPRCRCRSSAAG